MSDTSEGKTKVAGLIQGSPAGVDAEEEAGTEPGGQGPSEDDLTEEDGTPVENPSG
jgi:hypothetical protein